MRADVAAATHSVASCEFQDTSFAASDDEQRYLLTSAANNFMDDLCKSYIDNQISDR